MECWLIRLERGECRAIFIDISGDSLQTEEEESGNIHLSPQKWPLNTAVIQLEDHDLRGVSLCPQVKGEFQLTEGRPS